MLTTTAEMRRRAPGRAGSMLAASALLMACGSDPSALDAGAEMPDAQTRDAGSDWPVLLYDGVGPSPYDEMFVSWDPANPRPFLALERVEGVDPGWVHIAIGFSVGPDGGLWRRAGGTNNRVRVWHWENEQPELLVSGVSPTQLPGWDPESPFPLLVLVEADPDFWQIYSAVIDETGSISTVDGLEQRVFGWPSGGPPVVKDQTNTVWDEPPVLIDEWSVQNARPIVLMRTEDALVWRVSDTWIEDDGKVKSAPGRTLVWMW